MNKYHMKDSNLTLNATPENGWKFNSWSGDVNSSVNPLIISPSENIFIQANFENTTSVPYDNELDRIHIYPNPVTNGYLVLEFHESRAGVIIELTNLGGRRIMKETAGGNCSRMIINGFDELPGGVYILKLETEIQTVYKKILIR